MSKPLISLCAAALSLMVSVNCSFAADDSNKFIVENDPEFEQAMLKHFEKRFFKRIEATAEQQDKISKLLEAKLAANREKRLATRQALADLLKLVGDAQAGDEAIMAQAKKARALRAEMADQRLKTFLEVRAMLSEDQKRLLGERLKQVSTRLKVLMGGINENQLEADQMSGGDKDS
jgi:Spy/CpxP family protein refolding chaperone